MCSFDCLICIYVVGLSDSENNVTTKVIIVVFMIMNPITLVDFSIYQFINTMIINKET